VRESGLAPLLDAMMGRWFSQGFIEAEPGTIARMKAMMLATPTAGYIASCEAVRDMDHRDILGRVAAPTLINAGRHDVATPIAAAEYIRARIPGAALTLLDAGHISNIEQASDFTAEVMGFLMAK
jgi:3-oxoadipate enol-lactonase